MSMVQAVPNPHFGGVAVKLGTPNGRVIRMTVYAGAIRIGNDPTSLNTPPPFAGISGQVVSSAGGQVQQIWDGELWALGENDGTQPNPYLVDLDIINDNKGAGYPLNP